MNCPKCKRLFDVMWTERWLNHEGVYIISSVGHCDKCDFDGEWDITPAGEEVNLRQYFFG